MDKDETLIEDDILFLVNLAVSVTRTAKLIQAYKNIKCNTLL